jgi:hypothetical protein
MAFPLSINLSGCGVPAAGLAPYLQRGVRLSSLRAGYNAYGDEGVQLVAANLAGWGMRGCRSLVRTLLLQQAPLVSVVLSI